MKHVAVIVAGSIPVVAGCAATQVQLSSQVTFDAAPPTPTRRFGSIAAQWQPGDTTGVLAPQWQPGDTTNVLAPQWQPGDTTGVLAPQWTPPTVERAATSTSLADGEATTSTVTAASVPQDPAVQAAVAEQVGVTEAAYDEALRNPDDPTLIAALEAATVEGSPARAEFVGSYEAIVSAGRWAAPDPAVPNSASIIGDPYIAPGATEAVATVCHVSGDSLMGRDANGDEVVLADVRNARLIVQTFRLVDSTWKLFQREQLLLIPEGTSCDASTGSSPSSSESSPQ